MKKKFYFVVSNYGDEVDAVEEVTVDMDKIGDTSNDEYLTPDSWTCKTVRSYVSNFSQHHPGSFAWNPYRRSIIEYDPYWIICTNVFQDEEYMKKYSNPDPDDTRYYS